MLIQSLISSLDSCSVIQLSLNRSNKPEDQWSYKHLPESESQYKPDYWPGITTTMKRSTVVKTFAVAWQYHALVQEIVSGDMPYGQKTAWTTLFLYVFF